jgi:hypothetical protein
MFNFISAFFYRKVLEEDGPIHSNVSVVNFTSGRKEVSVNLKNRIIVTLPALPHNKLYGNCHGTGTHYNLNIAFYKAVSEAIERWAFLFSLNDKKNNNKLLLNYNKSTDGFAAMPGLFLNKVRERSLCEAYERHVIKYWWKHLIPVEKINNYKINLFENGKSNVYLLKQPNLKFNVILIVWKSLRLNFQTYGFACRYKLTDAIEAASIELERNVSILNRYYFSNVIFDQNTLNINEKRLLYFSQNYGAEAFDETIKYTECCKLKHFLPKLIVDSSVEGDWSSYAMVHRCLFEDSYEISKNSCTEPFEF